MNLVQVAAVAAAMFAQLPAPSAGPATATPPGAIVHDRSMVSLIYDIPLAAPDEGLVTSIAVREGSRVQQGTLILQLDDRQAQTARRVAEAELNVVKQRALNDVDVRNAQAARNVAEAELRQNQDANRRVPGTKSALEIRRLELAVTQTELEIERAQHEQRITGHQADALQARLDQALDDVERRKVVAPMDGEVIELQVQPGQWVRAGETVARMVRLDRLRVECFVDPAKVSPKEVADRPVRVHVALERGRMETFVGQIVFVQQINEAHGRYRVRAEVANRQEAGQWLLRPGQQADMTIEAGTLASRP